MNKGLVERRPVGSGNGVFVDVYPDGGPGRAGPRGVSWESEGTDAVADADAWVINATGARLEVPTTEAAARLGTIVGLIAGAIAEAGTGCSAGICAGIGLAVVADRVGRASIAGAGFGTRLGIGLKAALSGGKSVA